MILRRIFVCILFAPTATVGSQSDPESRILKRIFPDVKKIYAKPLLRSTDDLTVYLGMEITQLVEVSTPGQQLRVKGMLRMKWRNELISWDPREYENVTKVNIDANLAWIPEILIYDSIQQTGDEESTENNKDMWSTLSSVKSKTMVYHNGETVWNTPLSFRSACLFKVLRFPYDSQHCNIVFGPWSRNGIKVVSNALPVITSQYLRNAEWDVLEAKQESKIVTYNGVVGGISNVHINLFIERKYLYYEFNLLLPSLLLAMLMLVSHFLPLASGERIALGMTIKLALMFMFITSSISVLPKSTDSITLIYTGCIVLACLSILTTTIAQNIYHRTLLSSFINLPGFVERKFLSSDLWESSFWRDQTVEKEEEEEEGVFTLSNGNVETNGGFQIVAILREVKASTDDLIDHKFKDILKYFKLLNRNSREETRAEKLSLRNKSIAKLLDKTAFCIFFFCLSILFVIVTVVSRHNHV